MKRNKLATVQGEIHLKVRLILISILSALYYNLITALILNSAMSLFKARLF